MPMTTLADHLAERRARRRERLILAAEVVAIVLGTAVAAIAAPTILEQLGWIGGR